MQRGCLLACGQRTSVWDCVDAGRATASQAEPQVARTSEVAQWGPTSPPTSRLTGPPADGCARHQPGPLRDLQPFTGDFDKPVMLVSEGAVGESVLVSLITGTITDFSELPEGLDRDFPEHTRLLGD